MEAQIQDLQRRVMLLEGGNTPIQSQLTEQIERVITSVGSTSTALNTNISGELRELEGRINAKINKLLDYLESWISVGNMNMDDIREQIPLGDSGTDSGVSISELRTDMSLLRIDINTIALKFANLVDYLENWVGAGNLNMSNIKDAIEDNTEN